MRMRENRNIALAVISGVSSFMLDAFFLHGLDISAVPKPIACSIQWFEVKDQGILDCIILHRIDWKLMISYAKSESCSKNTAPSLCRHGILVLV